MTDTSHATNAERSAVRASVAALGALLVLGSLAGCAVVDELTVGREKEPQRHFATRDDAPSRATSTDSAWFLPEWVPEDANDIDVRLHTSEPGYVIRFSSESGVDRSRCTAVEGTAGGPAMTADFLPEELPTSGLVTCGDGRVTAQIGDAWYGWTTVDPIGGASGSDTLRQERQERQER